jgi:methylthioribose-1-phosphate isomerase
MKILNTLESEALKIWDEYVASDQAIAENGASSLSSIVFTHCNAGSLATPGVGTALGVVKAAFQQGQVKHVFVDETRPLLQGARLTATELRAEGISHTVICDNMAAAMLREQTLFHGASAVTVIVGADRIAADGSVANKIGTYSLAVAAHYHGVKFLVAAPNSTIDPNCATGSNIEIEERSQSEVLAWAPVIQKQDKSPLAPKVLSRVRNPAFDVTPSELINGIITENGVFTPEDILRSLQ